MAKQDSATRDHKSDRMFHTEGSCKAYSASAPSLHVKDLSPRGVPCQKANVCAEDLTHQLGLLAVLAKDLGVGPSTHMFTASCTTQI